MLWSDGTVLEWILLSSFAISLIAFVGIVSLAVRDELLDKIVLLLVGFSAGALMGGAFLHLLPEAIEGSESLNVFILVLFGFSAFFVLEKFLYWRHCHDGKCNVHTFSYMILIGDAVHNFTDGLILAASFLTSFELGITTFVAVALHEVPQEIGDFGVLVYGGFDKAKALALNFLSALTVILGGVVGYFVSGAVEGFAPALLPFTAGGFIYIAASGLIPEIKHETNAKKSFAALAMFALGIALMYSLKLFFK